jgi:hypothetical protein
MRDERGNLIHPGDWVLVTGYANSRGVSETMCGGTYTVLKLARTRVRIDYQGAERMVPAELTRVVKAVDGRRLRTWAEAQADLHARGTMAQ